MSPDPKGGHALDHILACIDASPYSAGVVDLTAWLASRLSASVELLHVIQRKDAVAARRDLSGAIGLGVKSGLLEELTRIDEAEGKLAIERGRLLLQAGIERLAAAGVAAVTPLHRHGGIVETIIEREADAGLVVIGRRGASGDFATDHLGSKVERVVRASIRPVMVAPQTFTTPATAVIAHDGSALAEKAVRFVASSPLFRDMAVHLVHAGLDHASQRNRLARAVEVVGRSADKVEARVLSGDAERAIAAYATSVPGGMLVMGAYGHSPLRRLIVGSTTTAMIRTVDAPILLVR